MPEPGPIYSEASKTVTAAGTPEALTTRDISCTSVFIVPLTSNTGSVYVVDSVTDAKRTPIPTAGVTLPIGNPALIQIDADTNGEGVSWLAV